MNKYALLQGGLILCPLLVLGLSFLPEGVALNFLAENQEGTVECRYPVFSGMSIRFGHLGLAMAGVSSGVLGLLGLLAAAGHGTRKSLAERSMLPLAAFTLILSGIHVLFEGFLCITWVMAAIWLLLALEVLAAWQARIIRNGR